jgi:LysM repeat protein
MQISHEKARTLIQFDMDQPLQPQEKKILQNHLEDCPDCCTFAEEIQELQTLLWPAMRNHWNLQPVPFPIEAVTGKRNTALKPSPILVIRTALISVIFAAFVFSAWQFAFSYPQASTPLPVSVLPIPTPSGQSTSTQISFSKCEEVTYQVQEHDTLEGIAAMFSASKDKIIALNHLSTESLFPKMALVIPLCHSTPTGTVHPSTLTITYTPLSHTTTSTPGG